MQSMSFNRGFAARQAPSFAAGVFARAPVSALFLMAHPILMALCSRLRPQEDFAHIDPAALAQIGFFAVAGLWLLAELRSMTPTLPRWLRSRPLVYLLGYVLLAGVSALWSAEPTLTLYRFLEISVGLGLVLHAAMMARDVRHALWMFVTYCLIAVAANVTMGVIQSMVAGQGSSLVRLVHANVGSAVAAVGMFLCMPFRKQGFFRIGFWLFLAAVVITTSSATYVAVLVTALFAILFRVSTTARNKALLIAACIALVITSIGLTGKLGKLIMYNKTAEAVRTGTGRLAMWQWYWDNAISEKPLLGQGFESGEHQYRRETGFISNAHNAFIAATVSLGVPGAALTFLLAGSMVWGAARVRGPIGTALVCACICIWINSLTIPAVSSRLRASWIATAWLCVLVTALAVRCAERGRAGPRKEIAG